MTITLPEDLERRVAEEAARLGTTAELLVLDAVRRQFQSEPTLETPTDGTLADFLKGYIGVVEGPGGNVSERCGELFAEGLEEKRRQGRL